MRRGWKAFSLRTSRVARPLSSALASALLTPHSNDAVTRPLNERMVIVALDTEGFPTLA